MNLDLKTELSKRVYPGAHRHPAFDCAWLLTELDAILEYRDELSRIAEWAVHLCRQMQPDIEAGTVTPYAEFYDLLEALKKAELL